MNALRTTIVAAAAALAMAGLAYGQASHDGHGAPDMESMMTDMMPKEGDTASTKAFKEADMNMMSSMGVPYTGNADVDFRTKMIPHHQGAIDMAKVALQYATDPTTRAMAEAIIAAQEKEIAEMQAWLAANGK